MKVLALPGKKFLHQSHAESLGGATFNLSLDERRIDCPANIVRRGNLRDPYSP